MGRDGYTTPPYFLLQSHREGWVLLWGGRPQVKKERIPQASPEVKLWSLSEDWGVYSSLNRGTKESHVLPYDITSRKLRGRLSVKALPHIFIPGLLLLLVELLSHVGLSCHSMDCSPTGSFVHGIIQGRILRWVAISSSRGSSWPRESLHLLQLLYHRRALYWWASREALYQA